MSLKNVYLNRTNSQVTESIRNKPGLTQSNSMVKDDGTAKIKTDANSLMSKMGFKNVNTGTREVLEKQKNQLLNNGVKNMNNTKLYETENLKSKGKIILELTEHIRNNANKYAGATLLSAGAGAGYMASNGGINNPLNTQNQQNQPTKQQNSTQPQKNWQEQIDDKTKEASTVSTKTDVNNDGGVLGALNSGLNHAGSVLRQGNKVESIKDAKQELNNAIESDGDLLTTGQAIGLGGAGLTAASLALLKSKKR